MSDHLVPANIDEFSFAEFTKQEWIGRGGEGGVFRGYNDRLGEVAVKRLNRPVNKTEMRKVILLAKHSNHPNIIRLFGLVTEEDYSPDGSTSCIGYIMEYMENGSLYNVIHNTSIEYNMKQVYSWIEKASSGLQYLHEEGVLHRDINPKNILLGKSLDDLKISDFGLAKMVESQTIASHTGGIGTIDYMAPELHHGTKYSKSADIYALTITFWEIIHRERPYGYMGTIPQCRQITRIVNGERPNIQEELEISALLKCGWDSNPESRPEISEFIEFSRKKRSAQENLRKVVSQQNLPTKNDEELNSPVRKRRKFLAQNEQSGGQQNTSVLILGGFQYLNTIYLLDSTAQSWKKLRITLPVVMRDFGAVVLNEEIYIFGGVANGYQQQDCYKLKDDGSWMKLASMNKKSEEISSSSLVYKGDIWAIGGYYNGSSLNSVEKYDISQDKWTYMPEMNYAKRHAAAAVFKDRIFVTGGWNEESLKPVEMFDPKLQKWILFCDLPIGLYGHTMLISNSTLSIFGGSSGFGQLNSVWEMDIEDPEKKWTKKQSFKHVRWSFGIGKLSNGIIVFGGWGRGDETSEIFAGNEWIDGPEMPQGLSHFAYTSIPRSLEERFLVLKDDNLADQLEASEFRTNQKTTSLEIGPAASCSFDLRLELENNERQLSDVESSIEELIQQENDLLVPIAAKRESTFEEQNTSTEESRLEINQETQKKIAMEKIEIGKENVYCTSNETGEMFTLEDYHTDDFKFFQPDNFLVDSAIFAHPMGSFLKKDSAEDNKKRLFESYTKKKKERILLLHERCGITMDMNGKVETFDLPENLKTLSIGVENIPIGLVANFLQTWKKKKNLQWLRLASFEKISNKQELADELLKDVKAELIWTVTDHDETMFCDTNIEEYKEKLQTKYGFGEDEDPVMLYFGASDDSTRLFTLVVSDYGIRLDFRPNDGKNGLDLLKQTFQNVTEIEDNTWVDKGLFEKIYSEL